MTKTPQDQDDTGDGSPDGVERASQPSLLVSALPLLLLIAALSYNVFVFGDDAVSGSNQLILIGAAAIAALLAIGQGLSWDRLQNGILDAIRLAAPAILILLLVGALSGTWLISGIIPAMIYYGLQILSPEIFLPGACIITALVALFTGSSWTSVATIGIALVGIGQVLGQNEAAVAGAIISGAYFGDKMSPLSDTTNLASAASNTELFAHVRYMALTTIPSITIAIVIFALIGSGSADSGATQRTEEISEVLRNTINLTPWLIAPPLIIVGLILKKVPALPAILAGVLLGAVLAPIFQADLLAKITNNSSYVSLMTVMYGDSAIVTGDATLDELLTAGGMQGMLTTIWLILAAMCFGGVMEASGFLRRITDFLVSRARTDLGLVSATAGTCVFTNVTAADQYLAVIVPGRMFANAYEERGLAPQNLSRTLEDAGTVTSPLVPWNTCGAFHAGVLGVSTLAYAPFAIFCYLSPIMTLAFMAFGIRIARIATAPDTKTVTTHLAMNR